MSVSVSVPETSLSSDGKYTLYHVSVSTGDKQYVLRKRYSDFANLKDELETLYSDAIPFEFPKKAFLRRTTNNPALTEQRRITFQSFLQGAINDKTHIKWRKSLPFREFLNLPPGVFSNVTESTKEHINNAWSLSSSKKDEPITDLSFWIDIARETKDTLVSARSKVFTSPSETRKKLIIGRSKFEALRKGLDIVEKQGLIGEGEVKRRGELLHSLKREHQDIEQLLSNISQFPEETKPGKASLSQARDQLFQGRVLGEPQETDRTRGLDNQKLLQLQRNDFKEQDQELEHLSRMIQKQKELGIAINEELQLQNELLDELDTEVDRTSGKLHYANKRIGKFT